MSQTMIENAVRAIDVSYPGAQWPSEALKPSPVNFRQQSCVVCRKSGFIETRRSESGDKEYYCRRCHSVSETVVYLKPNGNRVSETITRTRWEQSDESLYDHRWLDKLSKPAQLWIKWGHTSYFDFDDQLSKTALQNLQLWVYLEIAKNVNLKSDEKVDGEPTKEVVDRLLGLSRMVLNGRKCGKKLFSRCEMARHLGLPSHAFESQRCWGKRLTMAVSVIDRWESEVELI